MKKMSEKVERLWGDDPKQLWDIYRRGAMITGRSVKSEDEEDETGPRGSKAGGGVQGAYSLWWLFGKYDVDSLARSTLAQAYLGDEDCQRRLREEYNKSKAVDCDPEDYIGSAPNDRQWQAIKTALQSPISFIQGPPGTGKTATIINLIYQIAKLGKTAAVLSSNNSALENIHSKLAEEKGKKKEAAALAKRVAKLGGMVNRTDFYKEQKKLCPSLFSKQRTQPYYYFQEKEGAQVQRKSENKWLDEQEKSLRKYMRGRLEKDPLDEAAGTWLTDLEGLKELPEGKRSGKRRELLEKGWLIRYPGGTLQRVNEENGVTAGKFFDAPISEKDERYFPRSGFVAFTSTVHSLSNCFSDGLLYQYDYVIVDESSQMSLPVGLLAMSHAKHLVLVGDEEQLAPVVNERDLALLDGEDEESAELEDQRFYDRIADALDPDFSEEYDEEEREKDDIAHWKYYRPRPEVSFLDLCLDVFLGRKKGKKQVRRGGILLAGENPPKVFLNQHYRCHKGIIEFCNQTIYIPAGTPLDCRTSYDKSLTIPIKVLQFEGDYCERCYLPGKEKKGRSATRETEVAEAPTNDPWQVLEREWAAEGAAIPPEKRPGKTSKQNLRQVEIFMEKEWPELLKRLEGKEPFSVCILSPFQGQLRALERAIRASGAQFTEGEEKSERDKKDPSLLLLSLSIDNTSKKKKIKGKAVNTLTIHKSQGREFDVVYLLPVEDGVWEGVFAQKKRMVNVAVSRAKKELRIITSKKYMDDQSETEGEERDEGELYLRELVKYVRENATQEDREKGFGIQPCNLRSIFDGKKKTEENISAAQKAVEDLLAEIVPALEITWERREGWDREVRVADVVKELGVSKADVLKTLLGENFRSHIAYSKVSQFLRYASLDCVLRDESGRPFLAIEVDGSYHRYPWRDREKDKDATPEELYQRWLDRWRKDFLKDKIVEAMGGVVYYGNRKELTYLAKKTPQVLHQWDREKEGSFALLRLGDDGTTFLETDALRESGPEDMKEKVFTLQEIIKRYLPLSLSNLLRTWTQEEQDWLKAQLPAGKWPTNRVQSRLKELGVLEETDRRWRPTAVGEALGIELRQRDGATFPIYPANAKAAVKKLLLEGMEQEGRESPVADT